MLARLSEQVQAAQLEAPDSDLYGIPAAGDTYEDPAAEVLDFGVSGEEIHNELTEQADQLEAKLRELLEASNTPQAKIAAAEAIMADKRPREEDPAGWAVYIHWLQRQCDKASERL